MRRLLFLGASLGLAVLIAALEQGDSGGAFVRAAVANLAVVTWSSFALPLRGLPRFDEYYALRPWERSGRWYRALGVPLFRALVRRGPLAVFNPALREAWHLADPARIERETRAAEAGHAIAFGMVLVLAILAWARGDPERAAWLAVLDVPMNLYPVLLQRDHRLRLARHVQRGDLMPVGPSVRDEARSGTPAGSGH